MARVSLVQSLFLALVREIVVEQYEGYAVVQELVGTLEEAAGRG